MVDIDTLKRNYAALEDFQLMQISKEASQLSMDGFIVLKREILKRGLDSTIIDEQEKIRIDQKIDRINSNFANENRKFIIKILNLTLEKKREGFSNGEIIEVLKSEGVSNEAAFRIVGDIEKIVTELLTDAENGIQGSYVWFGIALIGSVVVVTEGWAKAFFF